MAFETFAGLTGNVTALVKDPGGAAPATIIQTDHDWEVDIDWHIDGFPVAAGLGGEWEVSVYAESIGPGQEKQVGDTMTVSLNTAPPLPLPRNYATTVSVPSVKTNAAKGLPAGRYKLVTAILYKNLGVPLEMAAFVEGPIIQVYEGQP